METKLPLKKVSGNGRLTHPNKESKNTYRKNRLFTQKEKERIVIEGQSSSKTIEEICLREGITPVQFYRWTQEFLLPPVKKIEDDKKILSDDDKYQIVLEGLNGEKSVAEICKREGITQDTFLLWSREFLKIRRDVQQKDIRETSGKRKILQKKAGKAVLHYIESFVDLSTADVYITSQDGQPFDSTQVKSQNIISLQKVNDIRYINKYFEAINRSLPMNGVFIGYFETFSARKERKKINKFPVIRDIYFGAEFIFKRVIPKISLTKKYYFDFTKGRDRLLSKAEALGRLVSSGFRIIDFKSIDGLTYFVVKKSGEPAYDPNPSYGPVYAMPRIGKNGKMIKVYKFRTMHPYSEYLQDYVLRVNGYAETGKPADDFRIPKWGKIMRRFWLDEIPQLLNVMKGEMKLVGIRPVSKRYFQDIPKEMQRLRITQKPGCIPPYVALNRKSDVMCVLQAEKDYLEEKIKNPYTTDLKYFFRALYNILIKHKRSA